MLPTVITTSALPEREQFAFWREACAEVLLGIRPEPPRARPGPFRAAMTATAAHGVHCMEFESDPHEVERGRREIGRVPWNACMIYRQLGPGSLFTRERERDEVVMRPGDLVVTDTDVPFGTRSAEGYRHRVWLLPRATLEPHLPADRLPLSVHLPAEGGVQGLLSDYLDALSGRLDALPKSSAGQVGGPPRPTGRPGLHRGNAPAVSGGREAVRAARLARPGGTSSGTWASRGSARRWSRRGRRLGAAAPALVRAERRDLHPLPDPAPAGGGPRRPGPAGRRPGHRAGAGLRLRQPADLLPGLPPRLRGGSERAARG